MRKVRKWGVARCRRENVAPYDRLAVRHKFSRDKRNKHSYPLRRYGAERDELQMKLPHFTALLLCKKKAIRVSVHQSVQPTAVVYELLTRFSI